MKSQSSINFYTQNFRSISNPASYKEEIIELLKIILISVIIFFFQLPEYLGLW